MKKINGLVKTALFILVAGSFLACSNDGGDSSSEVTPEETSQQTSEVNEEEDFSVTFEALDSASYKEKWTSISADFEQISMNPGKDITEMNYAWYSKTADQAKMRFATSEADLASATVIEGTCQEYKSMTIDEESVLFYANKVTVTELSEDTRYYYQYLCNGEWSEARSFKTGSSSDFSFFYIGDPQIGASSSSNLSEDFTTDETVYYSARYDSYNWDNVLISAYNNHPEVDFIVSAGDQINATRDNDLQEVEYAGFLSAQVLSALPLASTIGNHDAKYANYQNHFNTPNAYTEEEDASAAGYDYYYTYGNALFIVLNTNNYNVASHTALIQKAVEENPDMTWRIVTFHQDIYGSGPHSTSDGIILRTQITTLMDEYDIDVVLQGHDHTYSRTHMLTSDGESHTSYDKSADTRSDEFQADNLCYTIAEDVSETNTVTDPEGILYMESNSASGSKYYNLVTTQQDYIAERSQTQTPTYSVINIKGNTFTINTYDYESGEKIDEEFKIVKTK